MPGSEDQREVEFDQVSARLTEGLETCRAVVDAYRTALASSGGPGGSPINLDGDIPEPGKPPAAKH